MKSTDHGEQITLIQRRFRTLRPHLTERQRRLFAASEARAIGHGGVSLVAHATGLSRTTIHQGLTELQRRKPVSDPVPSRRPGGGRKNIAVFDPDILGLLEEQIDSSSGSSANNPLRWSCRSMREFAQELSHEGHPVSHASVAQLLRLLGYSLRGNGKAREEGSIRERQEQFHRIQSLISAYLQAGLPVLRCALDVDFREKDNEDTLPLPPPDSEISNWKPAPCCPHAIARASHCLCRWWHEFNEKVLPNAGRLLLCIDARGCSPPSVEVWRNELRRFTESYGLNLEVVHLPPGATRWKGIHHMEECCTVTQEEKRETRIRVAVATVNWTGDEKGVSCENGSPPTPLPEISETAGRWFYSLTPNR